MSCLFSFQLNLFFIFEKKIHCVNELGPFKKETEHIYLSIEDFARVWCKFSGERK